MSDHLSDSQISRYVERKGDADEILASAAHLDHCWECRDRTAAMVDDGAADRPHFVGTHAGTRTREVESAVRFRFLPWAIVIGLGILAMAFVLLAQK